MVTPSETLSINVTNKNDEPISGAQVSSLQWKTLDDGEFRLPLEILDHEGITHPKSDASGLLKITSVPRNAECTVIVKHLKFASAIGEYLIANERTRNVVMERGSSVTIHAIVAETGEAAHDATVSIYGSHRSFQIFDEPVNEDGQLTIRLPIAPRQATIRVHHPSLVTKQATVLSGGTGSGYFEIPLFRKAIARGRVVDAKSGKPQADVVVDIVNPIADQVIGSDVTDQRGDYEFEGPGGKAVFEVRDAKKFYGHTGKVGKGRHQKIDVVLVPGTTARVPDLQCMPTPIIRGMVLMPDGQPLAGAVVFGFATRHVRTDEEGRFAIPLVNVDEHDIEELRSVRSRSPIEPLTRDEIASLDLLDGGLFHYVRAWHPTEQFTSGAVLSPDEVFAGKNVQIILKPECAVDGTLVGKNGKPIANVPVVISTIPPHQPRQDQQWIAQRTAIPKTQIMSDEQGYYYFTGLYPNGHYKLAWGKHISEPRPESEKWNFTTFTTSETYQRVGHGPLRVSPSSAVKAGNEKERPMAGDLRCRAWINSSPISLASLRGKVVLLDFRSMRNPTNPLAIPTVQLVHELYKDKGLVVIGIGHHSESEADARHFSRENHLTYPIGLDRAQGTTRDGFMASSYSPNVLIDRNGKIIASGKSCEPLFEIVRRAVLYGDK